MAAGPTRAAVRSWDYRARCKIRRLAQAANLSATMDGRGNLIVTGLPGYKLAFSTGTRSASNGECFGRRNVFCYKPASSTTPQPGKPGISSADKLVASFDDWTWSPSGIPTAAFWKAIDNRHAPAFVGTAILRAIASKLRMEQHP